MSGDCICCHKYLCDIAVSVLCHCLCFWSVYTHFYTQFICDIFVRFLVLESSLRLCVFVLHVSNYARFTLVVCRERIMSGRTVEGVVFVVSHVCAL
jgi:hypothetical protein